MRKKIIVCTMLLVVASAVTGWAGPKLAVSEDNWEFGDAPNVGTVSHIFKLTNAGDALLKIISVSASCGCTSTRVENQVLKPGQSTGITATFNSAAFPSGGRFEKQITVLTDDSTAPSKVLTIGATVCTTEYAWGAVTPRAIEFREETGKGSEFWREVEIRNRTALTQRVMVLEKIGLVSVVKVANKTISPGGEGRLRVKVGTSQDPPPPSSFTLELLSKEGERRVSVPVFPKGNPSPQNPPKN